MADKAGGFPQIPARVWWGVRDLLNRTPKMKFDDGSLAATLDVQPVAARQYIAELKRIGLLDEKGAATELGERWRHDEGYEDVVGDILETSYPSGLVSIAPPGQAERSSVERWFSHAGLGSGTAKNKAGTYIMIANDRPGEIKVRSAPQRAEKPQAERRTPAPSKPPADKGGGQDNRQGGRTRTSSPLPLNLNVQIHISADASTDQIETIFAAMRKYLHDEPA
jgi:hypothetical protein